MGQPAAVMGDRISGTCAVHQIPTHILRDACTCGRTAITDDQKVALDQLHFRKIDMSDSIYVVNVAGYIGESTRREVAYAVFKRKSISFLEEIVGQEWMESHDIRHILGRQVADFALGKIPAL